MRGREGEPYCASLIKAEKDGTFGDEDVRIGDRHDRGNDRIAGVPPSPASVRYLTRVNSRPNDVVVSRLLAVLSSGHKKGPENRAYLSCGAEGGIRNAAPGGIVEKSRKLKRSIRTKRSKTPVEVQNRYTDRPRVLGG